MQSNLRCSAGEGGWRHVFLLFPIPGIYSFHLPFQRTISPEGSRRHWSYCKQETIKNLNFCFHLSGKQEREIGCELPLLSLINSINWYVNSICSFCKFWWFLIFHLWYRHVSDDYMMGISEIASSETYIPLKIHQWSRKHFEHSCFRCYNVISNFKNFDDKTSQQCHNDGMPTRTIKLYPSIASLPSKYYNISDVEAYIFPVTRSSDGRSIPVDYF